MSFTIRETDGGVGAFIDGIDLSAGLDDAARDDLRGALGAHGVLFFRDQDLSPEQHIALAESFGAINAKTTPYRASPSQIRETEPRKETTGAETKTEQAPI